MTAIAGLFWPKKFVATSAINVERFSAIVGGGTVAANADSYAVAAAVALTLARCAWPAVSAIQFR